MKKVLFIVHGLPPESYGGAEVYTKNLFNEFRLNSHIFEPILLTRTQSNPFWEGLIFADKDDPNIFFIHTPHSNIFDMTNFSLDDAFRDFLLDISPDVIHFQHYIHLSVSWLELAKRVCPASKLVLTVHEYLAMCPNSGQMMTTKVNGSKLCFKSSPSACSKCFPHIPIDVINKREKNMKKYLSFPDLIIGPSEFIKSRYIDFGVPSEKFYVSENGLNVFSQISSQRSEKYSSNDLSLMYLGQINKFKGLHILLEAMKKLENKNITLNIYGNFQDNFEYNNNVLEMINDLPNVVYNGKYKQDQLPEILKGVDTIVVPSIWWENSPLVIQEGFRAGIPIICSNIGGMAEKVLDKKNGIHFEVGSSDDLAKAILLLKKNRRLLNDLKANIPNVKTISDNRIELESIYSNF